MDERLQYMGRQAETELFVREMRMRLESLRDSLRELLDPFEKIEFLDTARIITLSAEFSRLHIDYVAALQQLAAIRKILGR